MISVGFYCNELPPAKTGGIGTFVRGLATDMHVLGHRAIVFGLYDVQKIQIDSDNGVKIYRIPRSKGPLFWLRDRWNVGRTCMGLVESENLDLVEIPDFEGMAAHWPKLNVPLVTRLHGSGSYFAREMNKPVKKIEYFFDRGSLKRSDFICSVSRYTAEKTAKLFDLNLGDIKVIYNGVATKQLKIAEKNKNKFFFSGTLVEKKGVFSLAQAWRTIATKMPNLELHIFGKDTLTSDGRSAKEKMLELLGPACSSVTFYGHVSREKMLENLATAQFAIFPSFAEAFALAPLESMAAGCTTIYSKRGSGPELIEDGVDGCLIEPSNIDEIVNTVMDLVNDLKKSIELGIKGRKTITEKFSAEASLEANLSYYQDCIRKKRG